LKSEEDKSDPYHPAKRDEMEDVEQGNKKQKNQSSRIGAEASSGDNGKSPLKCNLKRKCSGEDHGRNGGTKPETINRN